MIEYIVKYFIGNTMAELHVQAHDEKQAREIAVMQAHHRHNSRAKVDIMFVWKDGEPDPSLKELDKYRYY